MNDSTDNPMTATEHPEKDDTPGVEYDLETKERVIGTFHDRLQPGGYLLLGHSESLVALSSAFELCHLREDLVYRRAALGEERIDPWRRLAEQATADAERGGGLR